MAKETKITKREAYTAVVEGKVTDEIIEIYKGYIADLDKANAKRREKKNAEQAETDEKVLAVLTTEPVKASALKEASGLTSQKIVASCKRLEAEGKVVITKKENGSRNDSYYALAE